MKGYACPSGCVRCCTDRGSPVELTVGDMGRIAKFLGTTPRELMERYGEIMWNRIPGTRAFVPSLGLAFPCGFLSGGACRIYQVRPLGCRLFPEAPALSEDADRDLYRASGYPCFDRGVSVPPSRARQIERLTEIQREEARATVALFQNDAHVCFLSPVEVEGISRALDDVSSMERNARRRELCLGRIPSALRDRAREEFLAVLEALESGAFTGSPSPAESCAEAGEHAH